MKGSLWLETAPPAPTFAPLDADVTADVCVVGAGIVGVTAALLLQEAGARVVLIDAGRVGHGVTGHTTGKVSSQHGAIYAQLQSKHGARAAELYGAANEAALDWIEARGVDCDFRRRPSYVYGSREEMEREAAAATAAGLPASLVDEAPLPFAVEAAVRFDGQAEFHALKYLLGLERSTVARVRAHPRDPGRRRRPHAPAGRSPPSTRSWPRTSRSRIARWRSPARILSAPTPSRAGSPARPRKRCSSAPTRPRARSAPCRWTARSCSWSAAKATGPGPAATPSSATPRWRRSRASTGTCARSSTAGRRRTRSPSTRCRSSGR